MRPRRRSAGSGLGLARVVGVVGVAAVLAAVAGPGGGAAARPAGAWSGRWVAVPRVAGRDDVIAAYARLRRAGLRTAIPASFSIGSLCRPSAGTQAPAAGARVASGATVVLRQLRCPVGSPGGGYGQAVVPNLVGRSVSAAVRWAEAAGLYWQLDRAPPLRSSVRPALLDNYVVTAQLPVAGTLLARGVDCSSYATRCYRPTPLRLRARRRRG